MTYCPRLVDRHVDHLLGELPALLVVGPRAAGKTTSGLRRAASLVRLDQPGEAEAFRADADAALRGMKEPVLFDEWQEVPEILGAVKRAVDGDPRPGRFILTGSMRADLNTKMWPGTGRLVRVPMYGMTIREQLGRLTTPTLLSRVTAGDMLETPPDVPDLRGYLELAVKSGFPEAALRLTPETRPWWLESYVEQLLTRDALHVDGGRDPARLRRFFEAYALNSAGIVNDQTIFAAAGINRKTAIAYEQLLTNLLVVDSVPAWTSSRLKRLVLAPKRYVVDPALITSVLGLDVDAVLRDGALMGRILDTFVAAQLRAELMLARPTPRLHHLRQEQGRQEIDIVVELGAGRIIAMEIKADSAPKHEDAKHLIWLRNQLGDRLVAGIVFHTGPRVFVMDERIIAAPICALWA